MEVGSFFECYAVSEQEYDFLKEAERVGTTVGSVKRRRSDISEYRKKR